MTHWSISFVEHLRTTHIALVTLCCALTILASSTSDRDTSRAVTQITQILELQERWPEVQKTLFTDAVESNSPSPHKYSIELTSPFTRFKPAELGVYLLIDADELDQYELWRFSRDLKDRGPHTVGEFRTWWDQMHAGMTIHVPDFSRMRGCLANLEASDRAIASKWLPQEIGCSQGAKEKEDRVFAFGDLVNVARFAGYDTRAIEIFGRVERTFKYADSGGVRFADVEVAIDVPTTAARVTESSLKQFFSDWGGGPFDEAFEELATMTVEFRGLSIRDAAARLVAFEPKGERVVDALGLKVPASGISRWGTILLLALQLYFWVHLREFGRRVTASAPGLEVAWIGIYRSRAATAAMFASIFVLPIAAMLSLTARTWLGTPFDSIGVPQLLFIGTAAVACVAIAVSTAIDFFHVRKSIARNQI